MNNKCQIDLEQKRDIVSYAPRRTKVSSGDHQVIFTQPLQAPL